MESHPRAARRRVCLGLLTALAVTWTQPGRAAEPAGRGSYQDLVSLFGEVAPWSPYSGNARTLDFSQPAIAARSTELAAYQNRLADMNVAAWTVEQKVDWLAVRAHLDKQDFILKVTRPWARDPAFFVLELIEPTFVELPAKGADLEKLRSHLRSIPVVLKQARLSLGNASADHADLAIHLLTNSDGVENGYPQRAVAPAGAIGWHKDLLARADKQPELRRDIRAAIAAMEGYRDWLVANRARMTARAGVGKEALDWYIANVMMMPYSSDEVVTLSQRELDRLWGFYALERHRNRGLAELTLPTTAADYERRVATTDAAVRDWLVSKEFISIPDHIPSDYQAMGFNVPFIQRGTPPNFWEQVQYRAPSPDHFHAVIPGHRFDDRVTKRLANPIRSTLRFDGRWQGWAVYLEEAPVQAGYFADKPRERELIYIFGIWRAARSLGDVWNQRNELNADQSVDYWMSVTPLLDRAVARKYATLRPAPGHGLEYTMGNLQMWGLLAERKRQLGEKFVLKQFHDDFIGKGQLPISLIRYEMTGKDDEVKKFWDRQPLLAVN